MWDNFITDASEIMIAYRDNTESYESCCDKLWEKYSHCIDKEKLEFITNTISEIEADQIGFDETLKILSLNPSESKFEKYMDTPFKKLKVEFPELKNL